MNMHEEINEALKKAMSGLTEQKPEDVLPASNPEFGDYSSSVAMSLAREMRKSPHLIAKEIAQRIGDELSGYDIEVVKPGYINFRAKPERLMSLLGEILDAGEKYGDGKADEKIILEYGSANPTGPLHIGHSRGLIVGSALDSLLRKAGNRVKTEYYVNDAGGQVSDLARSVHYRARELAGFPNGDETPPYPGSYIKDIALTLINDYPAIVADPSPDFSPSSELAQMAVEEALAEIQGVLKQMGIVFDRFVHESSFPHKDITALFSDLEKSGDISSCEDGRKVFLSTKYGDDKDRHLMKSDGSLTYFGNDIFNHHLKCVTPGVGRIISLFGEDHAGYVDRIKGAVTAISGGELTLEIPIVRTVHMIKDGKNVTMSKRAGTFETVEDLINEVAPDTLRMSMLMRGPDSSFSFDIDEAKAEGKTSPVWSVNYANARMNSVLKKADDLGAGSSEATEDMSVEEREVLRITADFPRVIERAAEALQPHRVVTYARELADSVNAWWTAGMVDEGKRIIQGVPEDDERRLRVVGAAKQALGEAMRSVGLTPLEEMRAPEQTPEP